MDWHTRKLVISQRNGAIVLTLLNDRGTSLETVELKPEDYSPSQISQFLKSNGLRRSNVALGIRLAPERIFCRETVLPMEAARSVDAILVQELLRKTPFQLQDVYHDHAVRRSANKIQVWHWIVRKQFLTDATAGLRLGVDELAFIDTDGSETSDIPSPTIRLLRRATGERYGVGKALIGLVLTAALLASVAASLEYWRQQTALDQLGAQLMTVKAKAQQVRSTLERAEQSRATLLRIRSQKRDLPGVLDVWEEVSARLPRTSWLTELRLSEMPDGKQRQAVLTGFSDAAAGLVGLIDKAELFSGATLIAPISLDPVEQRERFVVQVNIEKRIPTGQSTQ